MKRLKMFLSALIALVLCAATICTIVLDNVQKVLADESDVLVKLTTDTTEVNEGDTLTVTLSIEKNPGLAGFGIRFTYDKDVLSLVSAAAPEDSAYDSAVIFPDEELLPEGTDLDAAADGIVGISYAEIKNKNKTGDILVATFKVKANAPVGKSTFEYSFIEASNASGDKLTISGEKADFKVKCAHTKTTEKITDPTCTEKGKKEIICDICGETIKTEEIAALDHDYGEYVETKAPTCTEKGERTATCKRCGDKKTEEVAALGHKFGEYVVTKKPTCTEKGEKEAECTVCGTKSVEEIPALGHSYEIIEVIKNEDGEEVIQKTCSVCDDVVIASIPKIEEEDFALTDIDGKESKNQYVVGDKIELSAVVYNMYEDEAEAGDVRYVPVAYQVDGKTIKFEDNTYLIKLNTETEGEYKIVVEYVREIYQTEGWVAGNETYLFDTVISVVKKESPSESDNKEDDKEGKKENITDNNNSKKNDGANSDNNGNNDNGNNSNNSNNTNDTKAPKTGDSVELVFMLILLMITSVVVIIFEKNVRKEL